MSYTRVNWQNKPSTATPINATNLNTMDEGIAANDAAIGTLNTAVQGKVDKVEGKGLSTNDFTDEDALKLAGIEDGAEVNVQADWDEEDNTADDYIKNKPDLSVYAEKDALWQDATATGNPVTIKTQSAQAAKSTELTMLPVQDLHGYGKPWVGGSGSNKWDEEWEVGGMLADTINSKNYIEVQASTAYYCVASNGAFYIVAYDANKESLGGQNVGRNSVYTTPASAKYIRFRMNSTYGTTYNNDIAINYPSSVTTYSPWKNICPITGRTGAEIVVKDEDDVTQDTVTRDYGQTVYGGSDNVETGVLTVTQKYIVLDGSDDEDWFQQPGQNKFRCSCLSVNEAKESTTGYVSNLYPFQGNGTQGSGTQTVDHAFYGQRAEGRIWIYDTNIADVTALKTMLTSTPMQVVVPLETPITTTLTAAQVNLIKGINNISTDADGISITYFADGESLADADNRITAVLGDFATVEGARASQNYSVGDYLIFSDKFCKASAAIASGEALAIGTNLTQTTIGAELKAILAQL